MPLSPIEVTRQTFRLSRRGYNEREVDEFLNEVVDSIKTYDERLRLAEELEDQPRACRSGSHSDQAPANDWWSECLARPRCGTDKLD